jgi:3-keto steroid reductase
VERLIQNVPDDINLTIVLTSRTFPGVKEAAVTLKKHVNTLNRKGIVYFDYLVFDQTNMVSMLAAAEEIRSRWKHVDYIFFNASYSLFNGLDYKQAFMDFLHGPVVAFTNGTFKKQGVGKLSGDGMGAVFQANVLAPWYLVKQILPCLEHGGKIIWISSCISLPEYLEADDIELVKNEHSYEGSKYEIELLHEAAWRSLYEQHGIESWLIQPGVFKSTTFVPTLHFMAYYGMIFMFYVCRLLGSPYHCIYPDKAANAPVWAACKADPKKDDQAVKYGSSTNMLGSERLHKDVVKHDPQLVKKVYDYVDGLVTVWQEKLKNQVVERHLF